MSGKSKNININVGLVDPKNNISIHDNKREYLKQKERKDTEALEADL